MDNDQVLRIGQVAKILNVSIETLRLWHKKGLLVPVTTIGGQRRYVKSQIDELLRKKVAKQAQALYRSRKRISTWLFE